MAEPNSKEYRLIGGVPYSLRELFSGQNDKIVIPDLQRDYCWGSETNNLVGPFIDSLLKLDKSDDLTMGMLYGYFDELLPNHLQLCDGQQRITTLFLLLGVLNRKLNNRYKSLLISDFELDMDDCEPYLQYSIRESSLYFISDLVLHYFLQHEDDDQALQKIDSIKECNWYLNSYASDPTIQCIISAIKTIEQKLELLVYAELVELGDFVSGLNEDEPKILFLYYDMENRTNGEETFVVINTTGEPLTANQNLKPLVIEQDGGKTPDVEHKWEEMETWFWRHRDKKCRPQHTSDEGLAEFLRCVRLYYAPNVSAYLNEVDSDESFPYKEISFDKIYSLFHCYQKLYTLDYSERNDVPILYNNKNNNGRYSAEQLYSLLPTLRYCAKFSDSTDEEVRRIYHLFRTVANYQDVNNRKDNERPEAPVVRAMQAVDEMCSTDILCLIDSDKINDNEKSKLEMIRENQARRRDVEIMLAKAEQKELFMRGRLKVVLDWCNNDFDVFTNYINKIFSLWEGECDNNIDQLRRALLTQKWSEYPIEVENRSHKSLGWYWKDWYRFFEKNSEEVKDFLDKNYDIETLIEDYSDVKNQYYPIIKNGSFLAASLEKKLYLGENNTFVLMEKERAQANYCIFYNGEAYPKRFLGEHWQTPWFGSGLLYCSHNHYDLTIYYKYKPESSDYSISLMSGKHKDRMPFKHLSEVEKFGMFPLEEGTSRWKSTYFDNVEDARKFITDVARWVDSFVTS